MKSLVGSDEGKEKWSPKYFLILTFTDTGGQVINHYWVTDRLPSTGTLPLSLSVLSSHSVSMTTLHPTPLQPAWHTQCHPLCSRVQRPWPLHRPGQPSGWRERGKDRQSVYQNTASHSSWLRRWGQMLLSFNLHKIQMSGHSKTFVTYLFIFHLTLNWIWWMICHWLGIILSPQN